MRRLWRLAAVLALGSLALAGRLEAAERLCDPAYEDCRSPLINYIRAENVGIDVAFWFMQDARYKTEVLNRWAAGVPVRLLVDPRANPTYPGNSDIIAAFQQAGVPIRYRTASGILHWKAMVFAGQNVVEFDGANYTPTAFVYQSPYSDYEDESIYFSDDPSIVNSFKTEYDNLWLDTTNYANYANINGPLARLYPIYTKDPGLNFPQQEDYALRILKRYAAETQKIDVIMYRITDERHTNAMIAAMQRGVPVRLIGETKEYRDPARQWVSYNMDRLYAAGVPLRVRAHDGLNHQKLVIMYSQGMAVFGSSNWTSPSANQQQEHNYFTTKPWMYQWFVDQFERKWNNTAPNGAIETGPFTPLPPDPPAYQSPADGTVGAPRSLEVRWDGGPWGQVYDIYFGTDPNPPLFAANRQLGPTDPDTPTVTQKWVLPLLQPGTTYYWKIVSKTMAGLTKSGPIASFTTAGTPPPPPSDPSGASTIVLWTATDVPAANLVGNWQFLTDSTAAGGRALWNVNHGQSILDPPLAAPANYFQTTFSAPAGVAYHLWVRLRAQSNSTSNNSVSVQFNDSIDQYGSPLYQIGTSGGAEVILTDPSGSLNNWGWADNGASDTLIYFPSTGIHTLQVQQRADGAIVDQIVLSPDAFMSTAPGGTLNDGTIYGSTLDGAPPPPGPPPGPPPPPPIPAPWQQQDIGAVGLPGYADFNSSSSTFSIVGAGADVWGSADAFHYVYQPMSGDGSIVARVASIQNTNAWSKAGVMIRESMAPGAADAYMLASASKGPTFQSRSATNGPTVSTSGTLKNPPMWVRLDRAGNAFSAYQSVDGVTWTKVGSTTTIPMAANVFVGIAVTSHNVDATTTAAVDSVTLNGQSTCVYSVTPSGQSIAAGGGTAAFAVATGNACTWTTTSNDTTWLTVTDGASGTGNGTAHVSAAANGGGARSATVTVGGQAFTVTQAAAGCSFSVAPGSLTLAMAGDTATVQVTTNSWCSWNATSGDPSWLTITSGASGTGSGSFSVAAAANSGGARSSAITVGGQTMTATQGAAACTYGLSPSSQSIASSASSTTFSVTTGSWCSWSATAGDPSWLTVTGGASGSGNGTITVSATANSGATRSTTVTVADQTGSVIQAAASCSFSLSPASASLAANGDATSFSVTTPSWCSWTATSSDPSWLTVTSGASGSGNGTVAVAAGANSGAARAATIVVGGQTFTGSQAAGAGASWSNQDIGAVGVGGSTTVTSASALSVTGAGADVWGTADALQYAFQPLVGDGSIVAHVSSIQNVNAWTKAGVMIRETTDPGSAQAFMLVSSSKGTAFQRRVAPGGVSTSTTGTANTAPFWVRIDRVGTIINAYQSANGVDWALVDSDTFSMAASVLIGVGVSSHTTSAAATANFDQVAITAGTPASPIALPSGWSQQDIGSVGAAGSGGYSAGSGTFTVKGSGADIWGTADAFHYVYKPMTGDGVVIARVASIQNVNAWTKAGVMIRQTLDPGSAQALMLVSYSKGLAFQRRTSNGGVSTSTSGSMATAPNWVKLERLGTTINAYASSDGTTWTLVGSDTISMTASVYVGLAVSSHTTTVAQATFDNVSTP